ncbi:MAG TPA: aldo/keto reductase [Thermoanaerobaculia bacterium]|nr:aldo/keto reductase [Thermoanaerobaculia bacterium]
MVTIAPVVGPALMRPLGRLGRNVTTVGLGTGSFPATGDPNVIRRCAAVVRHALCGRVNLIDCASNYAAGAAEAIVGCVLTDLIRAGTIERSQLIVCSKGGYSEHGESHSLEYEFLDRQLSTSLQRLQIEHIDVYFLHNPEEVLLREGRTAFVKVIHRAFEWLETAVALGRISAYGVATAEGLRQDGPAFHPLEELLAIATQIAGVSHHFSAIQVPFSLASLDGLLVPNHCIAGRLLPALTAARTCGLATIGSASLNRMHLPIGLLRQVAALSPSLTQPAQVALNFARSAPGLDCALFGTSNPIHLAQALEVLATPLVDLRAVVG